MAIQMRQGNEVDFDAEKMLPGEWAVSTDAKIVRICFAPGIVARMATYEAFEADMVKIEAILKNVQDIQTAVKLVQAKIDGKSELVAENASLAEQYMLKAKEYSELAGAFTGMQIAKRDLLGVVKGGDMAVDDDGALRNFRRAKGTNVTVTGTVEAPLSIKLYGKRVQETVPGNQLLDESLFVDAPYPTMYRIVLELNANTTYTISSDIPRSYNGSSAYIFLMDSAQDASTSVNGVWDGQNRSVTTLEDGILVVAYRIHPDYVTDLTLYHTMLNKGTTAIPWEPYTGGIPSPNPDYPQEIKSVVVNEVKVCGKNLLKNTAVSQTINGVTFTVNDDGAVVANGTATADVVCKVGAISQLPKGDYIGNGCPSGGSTSTYFGTIYKVVNGTNSTLASLTGKDVHFSLTETTEISYMARIANGSTVSNVTFYPMIRLASITDATYEPYTENTATLSQPIELRGIGDVMDELTADVVVRKFKKLKMSADLPWEYKKTNTYGNHNFQMRLERNGFPKGSISKAHIAAVKFTHFMYMDDLWDTEGLKRAKAYVYGDEVTISFPPDSKINSLESWKQFLTDNENYVQYIIAEPITEPLPEADQIALRSLHSYDGVTNVMCDAEIVPTMEAECATSNVAALAMYIKSDYVPRAKYNELESRLSALEKQIVNY